MTPGARINAAIDLMDQITGGDSADRALANWGRKNRYAGSKDRAAIGDIIYDVLRRKQSYARLGGGETGRALLLGYARASGIDPASDFGAGRYAPAALTAEELSWQPSGPHPTDFPDWLWPELERSHGPQALPITDALRQRAPVHVRVNLMKTTRQEAIAALQAEDISSAPHPLSPAALEVTEGARRVRNSATYLTGRVELQDASSQAVADLVPLEKGQSLLDYCAGGGGKALAIAGRVAARIFAHDIDPRRMRDLGARSARAGADITQLSSDEIQHYQQFDTVLLDAPCSGSGSWRRDPQGKWQLTPDRLKDIITVQQDILIRTAPLVKPGGHLVYATCSLLACENDAQVQEFLVKNSGFTRLSEHHFTPLSGSDGFYCAVLLRA